MTLRIKALQEPWAVPDSQRPIHIAVHPHRCAAVAVSNLLLGDLQHQCVKAHRVVIAHHALMLLAQNVAQLGLCYVGNESTTGTRTGSSKLRVVLGAVGLLQVNIGLLHGRNAVLGQFFDQPILVGAKGSFTAPACLGE